METTCHPEGQTVGERFLDTPVGCERPNVKDLKTHRTTGATTGDVSGKSTS